MSSSDPRSKSGLSQVYEGMRSELLRFLASRLGDAGEAEEVVQELYLKIHNASAGPIANGRAYLYRAAQNLALDRVRQRRRRMSRDGEWLAGHHPVSAANEPLDDGSDAERLLVEQEQAEALAAAIAAIPPGALRVFRMHKLEGIPHAEIARRLGITRSGVEKHMAVAMAHLRRALKE